VGVLNREGNTHRHGCVDPSSLSTPDWQLLLHNVCDPARALRLLVLVLSFAWTARTERRWRTIPDRLTASVASAACLLGVFMPTGGPLDLALGALIGAGVPMIARVVTRGGLGRGDIKLATALGLLVGARGVTVALVVASAGAWAVLMARGDEEGSSESGIAFGPYLVAGAIGATITLP
jgi:leader peptidase (prepilin peptidase)/N-methyltransferase